jgi:hypothetical protein
MKRILKVVQDLHIFFKQHVLKINLINEYIFNFSYKYLMFSSFVMLYIGPRLMIAPDPLKQDCSIRSLYEIWRKSSLNFRDLSDWFSAGWSLKKIMSTDFDEIHMG